MITHTNCECHGTPTVSARPRYFSRQLVAPDDLTAGVEYFREKLRRHNRMMHGWGVVCGARVCRTRDEADMEFKPWTVVVEPGYILGPYGDEIAIEERRTIDLRKLFGVSEAGDPWCSDVATDPLPLKLFLAVKYQEWPTRPVRVSPMGCGCDETLCEYSRVCDGYEFGLLEACPDPEAKPRLPTGDPNFPCPPCPTSPWVVLALVIVDPGGQIRAIRCDCHRTVLSFAQYWLPCREPVDGKADNDAERALTPEEIIRPAEN